MYLHDYFVKVYNPCPKIAQTKEKFGSLRCYVDNADKTVDGMIDLAEYISSKTCQSTGEKGELCVKGMWYSTLSLDKAKELGYKPCK